MLASRTPFRVSFTGGGSDLASFYRENGGAVVSTSIDKGVLITADRRFDDKIRLGYSKLELVDSIEELNHLRAKEILKLLSLDKSLELNSHGQVTAHGSGMGASSSFTVGMLNVLHALKGEKITPEKLAQEACMIEIEKCGEPIGKQDQYIAAYGGLNLIEFHQDDSVSVKAIDCLDQTKKDLEENLIMLYTGITRSASDILQKQNQNLVSNKEKSIIMKHMVQLTYELQKELENNNLDNFGAILHENRELKKQMAGGISSGQIDEWYMKALRAGATGGKLLGAGGGGFLLFYAPKEKHDDIKKALSDLKELEFRLDERGSRVTEIV